MVKTPAAFITNTQRGKWDNHAVQQTWVSQMHPVDSLQPADPQHPDSLLIRTAQHAAGLRVEVSGPGSYANTLAYWQTIAKVVREQCPRGVLLIDRTSGPPLSAEEWKALVDAMAGSGLEHVRIAHVKPQGLQRVEYCELFAREAGLIARVFTEESVADLWLRHGLSARSA